MIKKVLFLLSLLLLLGIFYFAIAFYPQLPIANGYAAKKMCSCTFIAERDQESIQADDLGFGPLSQTKTSIDRENKSVTTTLLGLTPRTAVYRDQVGCILLDGEDDHHTSLKITAPSLSTEEYWPLGSKINYDTLPTGVQLAKLQSAISSAFDKSMEMDSQMTRAVVVIYKGQLIAEKYAKGFDKNTEILGWSMTKSITAHMIGQLVDAGKLRLDQTNLFEEWKNDDRKNISLKDLLQMQSGLDFSEEYGIVSDATNMLFKSEDIVDIPLHSKLKYAPGEHWSYSSGTTNLLSELIKRTLGDEQAYLVYPYQQLFHRIGMTSAVIETDEAGTYIGSSYCYATPRDWAKFGWLYLNDGDWYGDQVIDSSWVHFVKTPAKHSSGYYGGHWWLNADHAAYKDVPSDLFSCNGFQGQYVFVIPSKNLVVVRMGLAEEPYFNVNDFLKNIIETLK